MVKLLRKILLSPQAVIVFVWLLIVLSNFRPGAWLIGWDNLHPEFSILMNIRRTIEVAWQEYQGLGLLGGMGHGADLIRQLLILVLQVFVPMQFIRPLLVFSSILVGGLGMFYFVQKISQKSFPNYSQTAGFFASIFYMLNWGTIQNFYVPFEPYYWLFACIPWLFIFLQKYLENPSKKNILLFFIASLLATPAGYLQTAFVVYTIIVAIFLLDYVVSKRTQTTLFERIKKSLIVVFIIFVTNSFWLLPVGYFTVSSLDVTINSKMNQLATSELLLRYNAYGSLTDVLRLRGYWHSMSDFSDEGELVPLLDNWLNHQESIFVVLSSWVMFVFVAIGIVAMHKQKMKWRWAITVSVIICAIALIGSNFPTGFILEILRSISPLFNQIFRSAFTKWIVPTSFIYSLIFGLGAAFFILQISKLISSSKKTVDVFLKIGLFVLILFYTLPSFSGNFIYSRMQRSLPTDYIALFDFFQSQPKSKRILFAPIHTFWGWNFYDWGYRGSGFLWHGIEQPILDRAFDVWSGYGETAYHQLSTAFYANDKDRFFKTLEQYNISYILLDENVIAPQKNNPDFLGYEKMHSWMEEINATPVFKTEKITVFEIPSTKNIENFIVAPTNKTQVVTSTGFTRLDSIYPEIGPYISDNKNKLTSQNSLQYPFEFVTKESLANEDIRFSDDYVHITWKAGEISPVTGSIVIPELTATDSFSLLADVFYENDIITVSFPYSPKITINEQTYPLINIAPITVKVDQDYQTPMLGINGRFFTITEGKHEKILLSSLSPGEKIETTVFDASSLFTEEGENIVLDENVENSEISKSIWDQAIPNKISVVNGIEKIELTLPFSHTPIDMQAAETTYAHNCDVFERGFIEKYTENERLTIKANNSAAHCYGNIIPYLSTKKPYLLRVTGGNISGENIKIFLNRVDSQHNYLETIIRGKEYEAVFPVLSSKNLDEETYNLAFNATSYGDVSSENYIKSSEFFELPVSLDWISKIHFIPDNYQSPENSVKLHSTQKKNLWNYRVHLESVEDNGVISLLQAYDAGWIAFIPYKGFLPHTKYNGWANAWLVPEGNHTIFILYWPQILSYVGYVVLVGTGVVLVVKVAREKKQKKK